MATLRVNIAANYAGHIWIVLMSLVFVPWYLKILGSEAFGLIGFMLSLQALSQILDLGLGGAVSRELAHLSESTHSSNQLRDLTFSLELLIWPLALMLSLAMWAFSKFIAVYWLNPVNFSITDTASSVAVLGLAVATFLPSAFYTNALSGLERQPQLNAVNAFFATIRAGGSLIVIYTWPTVLAFFWWHVLIGLIHSLALKHMLWKYMPIGHDAEFKYCELKRIMPFALGLLSISALAILLTQLDRIYLSTLRPLNELGVYTIAISVAAGLGKAVQPIFNAVYPRFCKLVAANDKQKILELYHLSSQILAVIIGSIAAVIIFFGKDIIALWTGNHFLAMEIYIPLIILTIGTMANGLLNMAYALQLANGLTTLTVRFNAVALVILLPLGLWMTKNWGMTGAALIWLLLNVCSFVVILPLMHKRLLQGNYLTWLFSDLFPPIFGAVIICLLSRSLLSTNSYSSISVLMLALVSFITIFAAFMLAPILRNYLINNFPKMRTLPKV